MVEAQAYKNTGGNGRKSSKLYCFRKRVSMKQDSYFRYRKVQPVLTSKYHKTVSTLQDQIRTFIQSTMGLTPPALNNGGSHVSELTPLLKIISGIQKVRLRNEALSAQQRPCNPGGKHGQNLKQQKI